MVRAKCEMSSRVGYNPCVLECVGYNYCVLECDIYIVWR